jgi:hypothetical protein
MYILKEIDISISFKYFILEYVYCYILKIHINPLFFVKIKIEEKN